MRPEERQTSSAPEEKKRNGRKTALLLLTVLVCLLLFAALYRSIRKSTARIVRDFASPYLRLGSKADELKSAWELRKLSRPQLIAALSVMERKQAELAAECAENRKLREENAELRRSMKLPARPGFRSTVAEITVRNGSFWREQFMISRGEKDGIRSGDLAVAVLEDGTVSAVGRVMETSRHTAVVSTLYAPDCRLSVYIGRTGECGELHCTPDLQMPVLSGLQTGSRVQKDDLIYTTGLSGFTPGGIPVGKAACFEGGKLLVSANGVTASLSVQMLALPEQCRFVCIYSRIKPVMPEEMP